MIFYTDMLDHISWRCHWSFLVTRAVYICAKTSFSNDSTVKKLLCSRKLWPDCQINLHVSTINYRLSPTEFFFLSCTLSVLFNVSFSRSTMFLGEGGGALHQYMFLGGTPPIFGYRWAAQGLNLWSCLKYSDTLFWTTPSILSPCMFKTRGKFMR